MRVELGPKRRSSQTSTNLEASRRIRMMMLARSASDISSLNQSNRRSTAPPSPGPPRQRSRTPLRPSLGADGAPARLQPAEPRGDNFLLSSRPGTTADPGRRGPRPPTRDGDESRTPPACNARIASSATRTATESTTLKRWYDIEGEAKRLPAVDAARTGSTPELVSRQRGPTSRRNSGPDGRKPCATTPPRDAPWIRAP